MKVWGVMNQKLKTFCVRKIFMLRMGHVEQITSSHVYHKRGSGNKAPSCWKLLGSGGLRPQPLDTFCNFSEKMSILTRFGWYYVRFYCHSQELNYEELKTTYKK